MSFRQIFDRISRLARANSLDGYGSSRDELRRAQELIDEENRRDRMKEKAKEGESRNPHEEETPEGGERGMTIEEACRILSVSRSATSREITLAYRRKIVEVHPDRHAHSSEHSQAEAKARTQELNLAYAYLKQHLRG
jgi:DnaJ-domain-containing protein 1